MSGTRPDPRRVGGGIGGRPKLLLTLILAPLVLIPAGTALFNLSRHFAPAEPTADADEAYKVATNGRCGTLPLPRKVELSAEYARTSRRGVIEAGSYDMETGVITVRKFREPVDSWVFARVLRHEYGHVFLHDYCRSRSDQAVAGMLAARISALGPYDDAWLGEELGPVYHDYTVDPEAFGAYASSSFGEWMAEAYVRYVGGAPLPAQTGRFFAKAAKMDRDIRECDHCHGR